MENKVVAIEMGEGTIIDRIIIPEDDFTTNKNYLGHTSDGIPVYTSKFLKQGEIKKIMSNQEYETLKEGKYLAKVEQVIRKHGKDANGNEDKNKEIISIELNVKGEDKRFYYISYCVKGYSDIQMQIANENIDKLMEDFGISIIEELAGKIVVLTAKVNDKGYTNMYIAPQKEFFDWSKIIQFDCEAKFPCVVKKFYKSKLGNKYTFVVNAKVNDKDVEEFVTYDLDNEYRKQSFDWVIEKLKVSLDDADKELNLGCLLIVKRVSKDNAVYFNKRIGFEKKQARKPQEW